MSATSTRLRRLVDAGPFLSAAVVGVLAAVLPVRAALSLRIVLLLCVPVIAAVGWLFAGLRKRERAAAQREEELALMNALSFRIASARSPEDIAEYVVRHVTSRLGSPRAALYAPNDGGAPARCLASAGVPTASSGEEALVRWVVRTGSAIGLSSRSAQEAPASVGAGEAVPGIVAQGVYVPLMTCDSLEGVLYAAPPVKSGAPIDSALLVAAANLVATSFERRRLEREAARAYVLREADRLKTTLVSSVSHELKTPLAAATARVTGLLDEGAADAERVRDELGEVASDLTRLDASIGDLLDLSRLESDEWRTERASQELGDILGIVISRLPAATRDRVRFRLSASAPMVSGDFSQLVRAFANLIENALAYSPADEPVVVTSAPRQNEVVVVIEDRGPGVADTEKERVFDKFYRGAASSRAPGTGLGLTISQEIVRNHQGRIWVEDAVPIGSRFVVALPVGAAERS